MCLHGKKVVVVGAGIGGLAAALALKGQGADVTILEQAAEIAEVGAGLQISPNGMAVLTALGLDGALTSRSVRGNAVVLRDYRRQGEVLRLDLRQYAAGLEYHFVHRADLIDLLAEAVRASGIQVRLLQRVEAASPGATPSLRMTNGATVEADLIVGADGLHSKLRRALNGETQPFFTGQVAWRATVPSDPQDVDEVNLFMGPGRHLVSYPLRRGELTNIVAVQERRDWAAEGWNHQDDPGNLRRAFSDFDGQARDMLARVDTVHLWGLFRHKVAENWFGEGLTILGDAAHPTLPFLAQGANMALEDAWVLADALAGADDVNAGLARYQSRRKERAKKVILAANSNAWKYHLRSPIVRTAAHGALRLAGALAPGRMVRQFDWLYRYDVTENCQRSRSTQTGT